LEQPFFLLVEGSQLAPTLVGQVPMDQIAAYPGLVVLMMTPRWREASAKLSCLPVRVFAERLDSAALTHWNRSLLARSG
jgi:hypothetical protein